jgi:hypothetical protein
MAPALSLLPAMSASAFQISVAAAMSWASSQFPAAQGLFDLPDCLGLHTSTGGRCIQPSRDPPYDCL